MVELDDLVEYASAVLLVLRGTAAVDNTVLYEKAGREKRRRGWRKNKDSFVLVQPVHLV